MTSLPTDGMLVLDNVVLSFPHIVQPYQYEDGQPSYKADFILEPNDPQIKKVEDAVSKLLKDQYGDDSKSVFENIKRLGKIGFGPGEKKVSQKTGEIHNSYEGKFYVSAACKPPRRPQIHVKGVGKIDHEKDVDAYERYARELYAGCKVRAVVKPWAQRKNLGVWFDFIGIQFKEDGTPLSKGEVDVSELFDHSDEDDDLLNGLV